MINPPCSVPACGEVSKRVPDCLSFLQMDLCPRHIAHLVAVRDDAKDVVDDSSFTSLAILREAQGLVRPNGLGAMTLLQGGL